MPAGFRRVLRCATLYLLFLLLPLLLLGGESLIYAFQVIAGRLHYPYELEWMEGGMLQQVLRVVHGEPLYGSAPTMDFIPALYMPLYYLLSALMVQIVGEGFLALRLVSVFATAMTFVLLFLIASRAVHSRLAGVLAVLFYATVFRHTAFWFDVGRLDALWTFWLLAAVYALLCCRTSPGLVNLLFFSLMSVVSFFTKQASVFLLPFVVLTIVCWCGWRFLIRYLSLCAVLGSIGLVLMHAFAGEDWFFYTLQMASSHGVTVFGAKRFFDIIGVAVPAMLLVAAVFPCVLHDSRQGRIGWLFILLGFFVLSLLSRAYAGAFFNVLMPLYAVLACAAAMAIAVLADRVFAEHRAGVAVLLLLLVLALTVDMLRYRYSPQQQWPEAKSAVNAGWLVERLRAVPGRVCVTSHGYLAWLAGKGFCAHNTQVTDLVTGSDPARAAQFLAETRARILSGYYEVIVLDREKELADLGVSLAEIPYSAMPLQYPDGEITFAVNGRSPRIWLQYNGSSLRGNPAVMP